MKDDFYIGWQPDAPDFFSQKIKKAVLVLFLLTAVVATSFVLSQRGFESSVFEFGEMKTIEGILMKTPVPMLKIYGKDSGVKSILLVGFGKMGAEKDLEAYEKEKEVDLNQKKVKLRGTRIYHDGKEILELTEGANSILEFAEADSPRAQKKDSFGEVSLRGEILDPKCALGVMKPGEGKPHRSCAVRCISGGVPPVFRMENSNGETNYCLIRARKGGAVNQEVLQYVADQVQICGNMQKEDDWLVLYTDPDSEILRLQPYWMSGEVPMCSSYSE